MRNRLPRRQVLRGLAGSAIALPWLEHAFRPAHAQGLTPDGHPKRLLVFFTPNGIIPEHFWPEHGTTPEDFQLSRTLAPLEAFKSKMLLLDGLNMDSASVGHGHEHQRGMGNVLVGQPLPEGNMGSVGGKSGWANGMSVDQEIANTIGTDTRLKSLEVGVQTEHYYGSHVLTRIAYQGPALPIPPENDPAAVFDRIFGDANVDPAELERVRRRQTSMLDTVKDQFGIIQARIGAEDAQRLESHLEMLREVETEVLRGAGPISGCQIPEKPSAFQADGGDVQNPEGDAETNFPIAVGSHIKLAAAAFACDTTRVMSIQLSNAKNYLRYPWVDSLSNGHDALSHAGPSDTAKREEFTTRHIWHAEQVADLLTRLDAIPEGNGSVLDNTLVFWCNELSTGNDHSHTRMPFVLFGGAGGHFKTGRYLDFKGQPHNNLLLSILHAFDIQAETFGDPEFCTGPLTELT